MGLFESESARSDKSLVFGGLPCKVLGHEADLVDHSLPSLPLSLSGPLDLEHLGLGESLDLGDGH